MFINIDLHSGVPVYRQIMDQVRFMIAAGSLRAGEEIPPIRGLAAALGINPMTISKAFGFLEMEGLVSRRPGRPLVVSEQSPDSLDSNKRGQLRQALQPCAAMTRQLGLSAEEAVAEFRSLLN